MARRWRAASEDRPVSTSVAGGGSPRWVGLDRCQERAGTVGGLLRPLVIQRWHIRRKTAGPHISGREESLSTDFGTIFHLGDKGRTHFTQALRPTGAGRVGLGQGSPLFTDRTYSILLLFFIWGTARVACFMDWRTLAALLSRHTANYAIQFTVSNISG